MSAAPDRVVFEWAKSRDESIRATLSTFHGRRRVDLRIYYADADDVERPTKRGISIPVEDLPKLREAVEAFEAALAEERAA
jgi:Transcriptional Coactivator p15 (PC4)